MLELFGLPLDEILAVLMFAGAFVLLLFGFPVALTLAGTALVMMGVALMFDIDVTGDLSLLSSRYLGTMRNELLVAVPLFIYMGVVLEKSRIAESLLITMAKLFGTMSGGLGLSVIFVGMLLAASTGIVGATVVTMGLLSLPAMLKAGYHPTVATGTICASGTLGQIIPPSIVLILLADQLSAPYTRATQDSGNWGAPPITALDLFAGALIPGVLLVVGYMAWIVVLTFINKRAVPSIPMENESDRTLGRYVGLMLLPWVALIIGVVMAYQHGLMDWIAETAGAVVYGVDEDGVAQPLSWLPGLLVIGCFALLVLKERLIGGMLIKNPARVENGVAVLRVFAPPVLLIFAVLGSILGGIASPTEAASVGAVGAMVLAAARRMLTVKMLKSVMDETLKVSTMVFMILLGASLFSLTFRSLHGERLVAEMLHSLAGDDGSYFWPMLVTMLVMFFLGFFLDFIEIVFVVVPIVAYPLFYLGVDPVWLAIMFAVNLQTSFLTPPFGFALFYLRGVAPDHIRTVDIYRGVVPYIIIQVAMLALIALLPDIATWLPSILM